MNETPTSGLQIEPTGDRRRVGAGRIAGATAPGRQQLAIRAGVNREQLDQELLPAPVQDPPCRLRQPPDRSRPRAEARGVIERWRRDYNGCDRTRPTVASSPGRAPPGRGRPAAQPRPAPPGARYHRGAGASMNNQDSHCRCGTDGEQVPLPIGSNQLPKNKIAWSLSAETATQALRASVRAIAGRQGSPAVRQRCVSAWICMWD